MGKVMVRGRTFEVDAAMLDLDGTMVDTLGDFHESLARMLVELGLSPIAPEPIAMMVGKGSEHLLVSVLNHVLTQDGQAPPAIKIDSIFPDAWASYQRHYAAVNGRSARVYPGVREGLDRLAASGVLLACVTNKPTAFAKDLLKAFDLLRFFEQVFGGDAFERKKPDPLPLLRTCTSLGAAPARTLMVGDSANDAQAARAAGCPVLLVTYGYNHGRPAREVDADAWVDSLAALTTTA